MGVLLHVNTLHMRESPRLCASMKRK